MSSWITVVIFYSLIIALIYFNRKKFEFQGKIIALYRTKIGIKLMDKIAGLFPKVLNFLGVVGIVLGYIGLFLITYLLVKGFFNFFLRPTAEPMLGLVLPGITTPLWYTLISIFIIASVHEFSHGVMSRLYNVKVKHTGIVFFGPIIGAFVEPDEKKLLKQKASKQLSIFSAGPVSNIVLAFLIIFLFGFSLPQINVFGLNIDIGHNITEKTALVDFGSIAPELLVYSGLEIEEVVSESAAAKAGLEKGVVITEINNIGIEENLTGFFEEISELKPGQELKLGTDKGLYYVTTEASEENATKGVIGISFKAVPNYSRKAINRYGLFGTIALYHIASILLWLIVLNFGIGLVNLLPLGPVDGGRIFYTTLATFLNKKKAYKIWKFVSIVCLILIIVNVVFPYLSKLFL